MTKVESRTPSEQQRPRRSGWRRWLGPALSLALIAAVFFWFLPQFTSISAVWTSVRDMSWVEVAVLLVAALWNLATYQILMMTTTPGLTFRQATVSTEATTGSPSLAKLFQSPEMSRHTDVLDREKPQEEFIA